ncbi:phosphorylase b kinase gamma catalytic chain, skeletal muscle/heart isoform-like isoform X2 [Physella acuta]|uniref:phosphorylase b kinase gamma catalytic chain, skeletal muscle/heart isoform-like isoform X2 n=1 Tax=Physella acuta TaxID=109671 RepID=UPI0027DC99A4|nr:phosphorylase b kinase gamma catalytic chain, skeletal muscle/heart isoform-like isoform X2 [Physella acuta]
MDCLVEDNGNANVLVDSEIVEGNLNSSHLEDCQQDSRSPQGVPCEMSPRTHNDLVYQTADRPRSYSSPFCMDADCRCNKNIQHAASTCAQEHSTSPSVLEAKKRSFTCGQTDLVAINNNFQTAVQNTEPCKLIDHSEGRGTEVKKLHSSTSAANTNSPITASLPKLVVTPDEQSGKNVNNSPSLRRKQSNSPVISSSNHNSCESKCVHNVDVEFRSVDILKKDLSLLKSEGEDSVNLSPRPQTLSSKIQNRLSGGRSHVNLRSRRVLQVSGRDLMYCDTPVSPIPKELLYELHDLDHENEDLSAEVVYSLQLRNYDIKQVLGKGISSTVRRVVEKTTGQEFAVKIIDISGEKGETAQVEQTKKDTYREIRILRMCAGHPNIIELHDVFETPTFIFLVFEICKKGELFDYLTSVVSLSEKRTRIFMRQLIEAVDFFHDKDIVHRDLKPENILLDDNLNIKVSDFGFATVVEPGEELVELCGTPGYLAPEVLAHSMYENVSGYGKEVDMWACGVIMYTLLCGAPPFWNRRQMMMLRAIMSADYTFNSPEWDDITEPPKNLIQKLLVLNPQERLTAKQALTHPFFHSMIAELHKFNARRKFRAGVYCVVFYNRLNFCYKHPQPISIETVRNNPYGLKALRKIIDTCAFGMYKHWVKRVDNQNRAALFEHTLRDDWKHNLMTIDGIQT